MASRPFKIGPHKWTYQSRGVFRLQVGTGYLEAVYKTVIYQWEIIGYNQYDDIVLDPQICATARKESVGLMMIEELKDILQPY